MQIQLGQCIRLDGNQLEVSSVGGTGGAGEVNHWELFLD